MLFFQIATVSGTSPTKLPPTLPTNPFSVMVFRRSATEPSYNEYTTLHSVMLLFQSASVFIPSPTKLPPIVPTVPFSCVVPNRYGSGFREECNWAFFKGIPLCIQTCFSTNLHLFRDLERHNRHVGGRYTSGLSSRYSRYGRQTERKGATCTGFVQHSQLNVPYRFESTAFENTDSVLRGVLLGWGAIAGTTAS